MIFIRVVYGDVVRRKAEKENKSKNLNDNIASRIELMDIMITCIQGR